MDNAGERLTEGNIFQGLIRLALPIMGTSFVQMTYNMMDMIWLGRAGSNSVAAVGTAGFYTWLAMAFIMIPKIGAEVGVAQAIGRGDREGARNNIRQTIQLVVFLGIIYGSALLILRKQLIGFFNLGDQQVFSMAITYLIIISSGIIFFFINPVLTGIFNGYGDSKTPFLINAIGLVFNMVLDPLLIFGIGPFPTWGVAGAALATISAQFIVTLIFIFSARKKLPLFTGIRYFIRPEWERVKWIVKLGFPVALQSGLFTLFAMFIARIIAGWGPVAIAVQKVGSQIEAISWMTASGFSTALSTFVGQNYGASRWKRIYRGYYTALAIVGVIGLGASALLIFGARPIFSFFIPEAGAVKIGIDYLRILGFSQLFVCLEITTAGAFNGLGRTLPPSIVGIVLNGLRIPGAKILSALPALGLSGVWWSISISSILKGLLLTSFFIILLYHDRELIAWKRPEQSILTPATETGHQEIYQ